MVPLKVKKKKSQADSEKRNMGIHHVQCEHYQSYLLYLYQNASIQDRQIQCRKDQMQVSNVPNSQSEILV